MSWTTSIPDLQLVEDVPFSYDVSQHTDGTFTTYIIDPTGAQLPTGLELSGSIIQGTVSQDQVVTGIRVGGAE